ncbi:VPS52 [Bugula neritina]|uniref:VPS52 n=1 Tax=Bugula neritina TaxID=10212 RepID=A0A7J7KP76_BUGNE|nr:VPS52 [Bugula neritina]
MILSVVAEHTSSESHHMDTFKSLLTSRTEEYVEEVLAPYFGGIMAFVKEAENRLEQDRAGDYAKHEPCIGTVAYLMFELWCCAGVTHQSHYDVISLSY